MHKDCFQAINSLQKNDVIIIIKPDKDSGVVLLNRSDHVEKINKILEDESKFKKFDPVSSNDNTVKIQLRFQKRLLFHHYVVAKSVLLGSCKVVQRLETFPIKVHIIS